MAFRVRQKVQCIAKPGEIRAPYQETVPEFGSIYTVRSTHTCEGVRGIRLEEIVNPNRPYWDGRHNTVTEIAFAECFFKPFNRGAAARVAAISDPELCMEAA